MTPTILIVGATGNTGKYVISNLAKLLEGSQYRILGLTRSLDSPTCKRLAAIPQVEMLEKDWTEIDAAWLEDQSVVKAFVAPHNLTHHFYDESDLLVAMLNANVQYVVKLSTMLEFIGPANPVFYGRAHWAIENLLGQPEFEGLHWTSLRPNVFTNAYLGPVAEWIKKFRETGQQDRLDLVPAADVPVSLIDPADIGRAAAALLALEDPSPHNKACYVLRGADDVTGRDIVTLVEEEIGAKVSEVEFKSTAMIDALAAYGICPDKAIPSIKAGCDFVWAGQATSYGTPTAQEILALAPPKVTAKEGLKRLLEGAE
ncbi:unnamed protein product [Clonostachys rosea]|uniref:NmrA-like domain-containing protein n=1 Tax=Bionectria ochroleuca TaxID=29856 RepID=A0ABY6U518_BIOOC|nr:unnamed protein product [Clonostachys rosea]